MVGGFENRGGEKRKTDKMFGEMKAKGEKNLNKHETIFEQFEDTTWISQTEKMKVAT